MVKKVSHYLKNGIGKFTWSFSPFKINFKSYELAIIGGGITGLGIARKAAMQGIKVILIERDELGSGTSGHFHELLHSGARYAVNDPVAAKECFEENQALSKPHSFIKAAIQQTGGIFVALTDRDIAYSEELIAACRKVGIPISDLDVNKVILREPRINRSIKRALSVPDGYVNGEKAIKINSDIAKSYGVDLLTHHTVVGFERKKDRIDALLVRNRKGETVTISCGFVINAAGPWTGRVGEMAGVDIPLIPYRGALLIFEEKLTGSVLNRCHAPANGDIFVPAGSHTIFGTTSKKIDDIDDFTIAKDEVAMLLAEGERMIPGLAKCSIVNKYSGFRPLYAPTTGSTHGRKLSRSFTIINHKENGITNFISVVGGKFTIYEKMGDMALTVMKQNLQSTHPLTQLPNDQPTP